MVQRNYKYTGLSLLQESLGVYNYTVDSTDGLVYNPTVGDETETITGSAYHTHHAFEGPDVLWTGVKLDLTHSTTEATPSYENVISLYGLNDGHVQELVAEKIYTSINTTPTMVKVAFDLLSSACQPAFYKVDETAGSGVVRVNLPFRSTNYEDIYLTKSWLSGWSRRKLLPVTGVGPSRFNIPVETTLTYDSDMEADFGDVRFTDSDGVTLLDHALLYKTDSTSAEYGVEIPYTPNTGDVKNIYVYYDGTDTTSDSNPWDTYTLYDDFEDGLWGQYYTDSGTTRSLPYLDWLRRGGTAAVESGSPLLGGYSVKHTGGGSDTVANRLFQYHTPTTRPKHVSFRFQLATQGSAAQTPYVYLWFLHYQDSANFVVVRTFYSSGTGKQVLQAVKTVGGSETNIDIADWLTGKLGTSTAYDFMITDSGAVITVSVDGVEILNGSYSTTMTSAQHGFGANADSAGYWDIIRTRPWNTAQTPTLGAYGSEEVSTVTTVTPSTTGTDYLLFSTPADWSDGNYWYLSGQEYGSSIQDTRSVPMTGGDTFRLGYDAVDKYNTLRVGVSTTTTTTPYTVSVDNIEYSYEV